MWLSLKSTTGHNKTLLVTTRIAIPDTGCTQFEVPESYMYPNINKAGLLIINDLVFA